MSIRRSAYKVLTLTLILFLSACSLPRGIAVLPTLANPSIISSATPNGELNPGTPTASMEVNIPFASLTPFYVTYPGEPPGMLSAVKDEIFPSNYGDNYSINLYERPFQLDNTYRPDADIAASILSSDNLWYYFSTETVDIDPYTKTMDTPFGFEIDFDKDGRGDFLLWATPPYSTSWANTDVQVYADTNRDVGNRHPVLSDAPATLVSNGYEYTVISNGRGPDPEVAWARLSPGSPTTMQFAIKKSLINHNAFLWWAWTDFDIGKPELFDYNDAYTIQEAGSPYASNPYFPPKALYGMDNTCRVAFGFTPVGNEPGLCKGVQPTLTPTTKVIKTYVPNQNPSPTITPIRVYLPSYTPTATPQPLPQTGTIAGIVYFDNNANGVFDAGDEGKDTYEMRLFQNSTCSDLAYLGARPALDGNYTLTNLPAGTWCLRLNYTGSPILPGNPQVVVVNGGSITTIDFAIQPPG
jgi:hypothetical protein